MRIPFAYLALLHLSPFRFFVQGTQATRVHTEPHTFRPTFVAGLADGLSNCVSSPSTVSSVCSGESKV